MHIGAVGCPLGADGTEPVRSRRIHNRRNRWPISPAARAESWSALSPSPFKVTQLVGDYGHLRWGYAHYEPNQVDRDTRVDVEKLDATG